MAAFLAEIVDSGAQTSKMRRPSRPSIAISSKSLTFADSRAVVTRA